MEHSLINDDFDPGFGEPEIQSSRFRLKGKWCMDTYREGMSKWRQLYFLSCQPL